MSDLDPPFLPIDASIPDVARALDAGANVVLVAPPGAGKTTRLPLKLLPADWLEDAKIVMVVPRRLAALGAARRMAAELDEDVGQTIGHRVRFDTKVSAATRLEIVTDGVFTRMIAADPELSGIGLVIFDEVHERALAADLGLAFALEAQSVLRPDLRLMAMSATVDGAKFERLLTANGMCEQITSDGAMFQVTTHHEPSDKRPVEAVVQAAIQALRRFEGDGLIFLPGGREIEQVAADLRSVSSDAVAVHTLYGAVPRGVQDAALAPDAQGRRKLVVASAIAETSLTIPGVRFVVDSGLARRPTYDPVRGITRLETRAASRASIDQRRGRAGRTAPGDCIRLWRVEEEGGRAAQDRPEILDADLASLRLEMAVWGSLAPDGLPFLDLPPQRAWGEAGRLLTSLGALDQQGAATSLGTRMAKRPTHPRLAAMLERAQSSEASDVAWAAVLAGELSGRGALDASERLSVALKEKRQAKTLQNLHRRFLGTAKSEPPPDARALAGHLLHAFPDRIAKRQKDDGQRAVYKLVQGMQAQIETHHPLSREPTILVLDLGGGRKAGAARVPDVRLALPLDDTMLYDELAAQIESVETAIFDPQSWTVRVRRETRLGALALGEEARPRRSGQDALPEIVRHLRQAGLDKLVGDDKRAAALLARYQAFFASRDAPDALLERVDLWLPYLLEKAPVPPIDASILQTAFTGVLSWEEGQAFEKQWPASIALGEDRRARIQYDHPAGPAISVRPQWLYGVDRHPTFGVESQPILIEMLSPAQRPIALTADLPAFWRTGWTDVRKDMRTRYPKHNWPKEPWKG